MRIISGKSGGVRLSAPEGMGVRPTEDRVKESMFSTLGDLTGKTVLDLFAGTGALGLEALSRGAAVVHGFELEKRHCDIIRRNLAAMGKTLGTEQTARYILHTGDVARAAQELPEGLRADVILADPPYETAAGAYGWRELMLDRGLAERMVPGGMLVLEHGSDRELPWYPESPWKCLRVKVFGIRAVSFAVLSERK